MSNKPFSQEEQEQLARLSALRDDEIDTADIPEAPAENWSDAKRGRFYRPLKRPVTIRLDVDVVSWFKEHAGGGSYQSEINRVLRRQVVDAEKS